MSYFVIKLKGNEQTVGAGAANTTVSNAVLVRLVNNTAAAVVVSQYPNAANATNQIANCTILASTEIFLQKAPTDVINATASILGVPVAFRD